jgi:hypothetical protein
MMTITPPMYGEGAPEKQDESVGEQPMMEEKQISAIEKLVGQFNQEIDFAESGRLPKEYKWIKVERYLAGKDVQEPPDGYEESTFFYRRLPRIVQVGKAKLFKHVWPIQGRPWEIKASPRHGQGDYDHLEDQRISRLREEIEDQSEAMEMENLMDDTCEFMASLGSAVAYGPVQLSEPRLRWADGDETIDESDKLKPMWKFYDPKHVYPDPNGRRAQDLEYVYFHHVMSAHQIRSLQDDPTFINEELAELLLDMPYGNWAGNLKKWETAPNQTSLSNQGVSNNITMNRFIVWMRVGLLTAEALKDLGEKFPKIKDLDAEQTKVMTDSMWEIWFCGDHVLKISKRKFQPKRMPVSFIPFRRDPTSIFGIGAGEAALECTEMLINIVRSIDDALADTSGFQAMIDAGAVENKDLTIKGRKTWIYRNKGTARKEGPNGKPIDFFTVPSNLPHLLECFKLFESMIPVCTGFSEMTTGIDMGSGVRTDSMMNEVWAALEEFIKDVVGNVDRYWWKPFLRDSYNWIQAYYPNAAEFKTAANLQVQGVRGALRRELVGRKIADLYKELHQFGLPDWFDEIFLAKIIAEGMGVEEEKAVLTPQQFVEKQQLKAEQAKAMAAAKQAPEDASKEKERAHTSSRDAMMDSFKSLVGQDPNNPVLIPLMEKILKLTGEVDPKATAALSIWSKMIAQNLMAQGVATQEEAQILEQPMKADNPLELAPGARNPEQAAQAAQTGQTPKTPPNPVPAMPTTQQIPGGMV